MSSYNIISWKDKDIIQNTLLYEYEYPFNKFFRETS